MTQDRRFLDAGEQVIAVETERGRGRASGAAVEMHMTGIWTIRGGKVVWVEWLEGRDPAEARDAALKVVQLGGSPLDEKQ